MSEKEYSRRKFIKSAGGFGAGLLGSALFGTAPLVKTASSDSNPSKDILTESGESASAQADADFQNRPNIIFILTDDQRWDALGYAGNPIIHTPEMDRLAADGVYFKNAFVTTPICAASRASILTGLYERTHGFTFRTPPLSQKYVRFSYPALLKKAGYRTGFIGKFGMTLEDDEDKNLFDVYERPGEEFWARTFYRLFEDPETHELRDFIHLTDLIGNQSLDFIEKFRDEPFCLSISFHAPHAEDVDPRQYIWPQHVDHLYRDVTIPEPEMSDPGWFDRQPPWVKEGLNRIRWYWRFTPDKYQEMVKGYYRMISGVDCVIGRLRNRLEELKIDDNTIIILLGDNGYFLGERGFAGKWLLYEPSLRVPLIVYDPRAEVEQNIREEMALNIDVSPTILDYAGIGIPAEIQGKSLKNLVDNRVDGWRDYMICEHLFERQTIPKSEGIRTDRYKFFRYIDHPEHEEFYDLINDPQERIDLIGDKGYSEMIKKLREKLDSELSKLTDSR